MTFPGFGKPTDLSLCQQIWEAPEGNVRWKRFLSAFAVRCPFLARWQVIKDDSEKHN